MSRQLEKYRSRLAVTAVTPRVSLCGTSDSAGTDLIGITLSCSSLPQETTGVVEETVAGSAGATSPLAQHTTCTACKKFCTSSAVGTPEGFFIKRKKIINYCVLGRCQLRQVWESMFAFAGFQRQSSVRPSYVILDDFTSGYERKQ